MRGDRKSTVEQEHDKLLNDDQSVCETCGGLRTRGMHFVCVCASLEHYHSQAEHNQRTSHLQSVIRMLISPWELT